MEKEFFVTKDPLAGWDGKLDDNKLNQGLMFGW